MTTIPTASASDRIDARVRELSGWRGELLARVRSLILATDPQIIEEWKWRGVPVWSRAGILCTGESYRDKIKLTFAHGAALPDPAGLFNASLDGNVRRAIDLTETAALDDGAFQALVHAAIALNLSRSRKPS